MRRSSTIGLAFLASTAVSCPAWATELKEVGTIAVPSGKLANFDISYIDPTTGRYYAANAAIRPSTVSIL